ncbi:MAG: DUF1501 domain-containing protein [Oligoflexia bacterium]|nr:DUF1501 domain-containing protein [Oligoflexia bacterium]
MKRDFTRRDFLRLVSAGTCGAAVHRVLSPRNGMLAFGAPATLPALGSQAVLVVVNLAGGCSYNIAPIYHGAYRDKNPTISYGPENSLILTPDQGVHPSLTYFKKLYDQGRLAVMNGVAHPQNNRSHAESTENWFSGIYDGASATQGGWGARLTCQMASVFGGVSLGGSISLMQGSCNDGRSFGDLSNFGEDQIFWDSRQSRYLKAYRDQVIANSFVPASNDNLAYVKNASDNLAASIDAVKSATNVTLPTSYTEPGDATPTAITFNGGFGASCRDAAKLIAGTALGVQLIYLEHGGFDTHQMERNSLPGTLAEVNAGIQALVLTAKAMGFWNRMVIVTMSEFCRTFENGSQGTDHGRAAPMFMMGGAISGGVKNMPPSPAQTSGDYYNLMDIDCREPFKHVVYQMGYDHNKVFPGPINMKNLSLFL